MSAATPKKRTPSANTIATNRKARRDFHVLESIEVGIELRGAEVKSIRARDVSLDESYAKAEGREVVLHGMHVAPYRHSRVEELEPRRPRRLLLHRREILKLTGQVNQKGLTLIPLKLYLKHGRIKVELGICKGKDSGDKRETLRRKTAEREVAREISERRKR